MTGAVETSANRSRLWQMIFAASTFAFALFPWAYAEDESQIKATLLQDGSLVLKGTANYYDLAFGGADTGFSNDGPLGIRSVTFGEHLMIKGELNKELLKQQDTAGGGSLYIEPGGITREDRRDKGGWWAWYSNLAQTLALSWRAAIPGQMQVLLQVMPDGQVSIVEQEAFFPAADANNKIETAKANPDLPSNFRDDLKAALAKISKNGTAKYPAGSSASRVLLMATFVADHDLQVSVPDLREFDGLPQDDLSIRVARICCVLDSAFLFEQSDHLRLLLPEAWHHKFIPDGLKHQFYSKSKDGFYCIDNGTSANGSSLAQLSPYAQKVFDDYFKIRDFAAAERFAKALAAQACISDNDLKRTAKLIADHLEFLRDFTDAEKLRSSLPRAN